MIESNVAGIVKSVQKLKESVDRERERRPGERNEIASLSSVDSNEVGSPNPPKEKEVMLSKSLDVHGRVELFVEEIRTCGVFSSELAEIKMSINEKDTLPAELVLLLEAMNGNASTKDIFKLATEEFLKLGNSLIQKARLACGVWPPPSAFDDLTNGLIDILKSTKRFAKVSEGLVKFMCSKIDREREKKMTWQREVMKSEALREVFRMYDENQLPESDDVIFNIFVTKNFIV